MDTCYRTKTRSDSSEFSQQDLRMTEPMSTEWTDEKHGLYLKSMEASFVNQLYSSMDLDCQSDPNLSQHVHSDVRTPSGQFKVLRGGCWQKIHFQRPRSQVSALDEPDDFVISPWIQHFRSARKPQAVVQERGALQHQSTKSRGKKIVSSATGHCPKHSYKCRCYSSHDDLLDSKTEVSDQNFVDENITNEKNSSVCNSKRMKTRKSGSSVSDQVVPHGKPPATENKAAARK